MRRPLTYLRDMATISAGTVGQRLLGGFMLILLARWLAPTEYGRLTLAYMVMVTVAQVPASVDVGFVALYLRDRTIRPDLAVAYRNLMGALAFLVVVVGCGTAEYLAENVFRETDAAALIRLSLAGGALYMLFLNGPAYLQATGRLWTMSAALVTYAALQMGAALFVKLALGSTEATVYVGAWTLVTGLTAVWAMALSGRPFRPLSMELVALRRLLSLSKWITVGTAAYAVAQGADFFILAYFVDAQDLGTYSVGLRYASLLAIATAAFTMLSLSKGAASRTTVALARYLRSSGEIAVLLLCFAGVLLVLAGHLLPLIFGDEYRSAVPLARLLIVASVPTVLLVPLANAFYGADRLPWIAGLNVGQLLVAIGGGALLIRSFGSYGAAWSVLVSRGTGLIIAVIGIRVVLGPDWRSIVSVKSAV